MAKGKSKAKDNVSGPWKSNSSTSARNLRKNELGAVIFGTKNHTISECLNKKLFGLPEGHFSYVKKITPGLPLFLFNYSDRLLHGIFEATSEGKRMIDSHAWISSEGTGITPYAAQVRFKVQKHCLPLREEDFRPVIVNNYFKDNLFWFELDTDQTSKLTKLFLLSSPSTQKICSLGLKEHPTANQIKSKECNDQSIPVNVNRNFPSQDNKCIELIKSSSSFEMNVDDNTEKQAISHIPEVKVKLWTELFKASSSTSEVNHDNGFQKQKIDGSSSMQYLDRDFASSSPSHEVTMPELHVPSVQHTWEESWDKDIDLRDDVSFSECMIAKTDGEAVLDVIETCEPESVVTALYENNHRQNPDYGPLVMKLMQEIEQLKYSQTNQWIKFNSLEREVRNGSGCGINQLKDESVTDHQPKVQEIIQTVISSPAAFDDPSVRCKIRDMETEISGLKKKLKTVHVLIPIFLFISIVSSRGYW